MSSDDKFGKSPEHFMVLDAVSGDINNVEKIARSTKLNNQEIQFILNDLLI
jgi:predicted Fe-Mo cluster-binding NifX family protein